MNSSNNANFNLNNNNNNSAAKSNKQSIKLDDLEEAYINQVISCKTFFVYTDEETVQVNFVPGKS